MAGDWRAALVFYAIASIVWLGKAASVRLIEERNRGNGETMGEVRRMASVKNVNGESAFIEHDGVRFAAAAASPLFVPANGGFHSRGIRVAILPEPKPAPCGERRIAMLIDGDNAQPALVARVLSAAEKHGVVTVRRVYGNWSSQNMSGWSEGVRSLGMRPVHQVSTATGKNAADIALAIDAMDLMHGGTVDGFCIVSSDGDYTGLAVRIREQGMFAMGAGRRDTPASFVNACDVFVVADDSPNKPANHPKPAPAPKPQPKPAPAPKPQPNRPKWTMTVANAIDANKKSDGWALLSSVGSHLKNSIRHLTANSTVTRSCRISSNRVPICLGARGLGLTYMSETSHSPNAGRHPRLANS